MDWFAVLASILSGVSVIIVGALAKYIKNLIAEFKQEHAALVEATRDNIKGQILTIHSNAFQRGYITYVELEYVNDKFPLYENLNGNTYVPQIVEDCNHMKVGGMPVPSH